MPYKNPEDRKKNAAKYREGNRDKIRAYYRGYSKRRREHLKQLHNEWMTKNPEKAKEMYSRYFLKVTYKLTPEQYMIILTEQNGRCACCGKPASENVRGQRLFVDHDHNTGKVRGLLCHGCNSGIGHLGDTLEAVQRALEYLQKARNL